MPLIKSVSGVRGIVRANDPSNVTMNEDVAARMGRAYATHLLRSNTGDPLTLVGGRDGRPGGDVLLSAFAGGTRASGVDLIDVGIVSTPGVAMAVINHRAAGGVVITASHNPSEWNGIKLMTAAGNAPPPVQAQEIFQVFDRQDFEERAIKPRSASAEKAPGTCHVEAVLKTVDVQRIRQRRYAVVLDSINGAGSAEGRLLLEQLGCRLIHMNPYPADEFAHAPEPIESNLLELASRVRTEGADIGFAQDPDADRLAVVDENGRFIGEEYTLALCASRIFETAAGPAAANLSTSRMIDDIADQAGPRCTVHRSAVGEAHVVDVMRANHCVIGGEGNGGVIDPRVVYVRDSLVAMAIILDLLVARELTVSQLVKGLPAYAMFKEKFTCDADRIPNALEATRAAFAGGQVNDVDGVRIDWPDRRAWVHVRGSNTEPIVRAIVEAPHDDSAMELMSRAQKAVQSVL